jgi:hypothetical protein
MIDNTKSLVIFSHPRSGSTWFQNSLKHYSLGELFNLNIQVEKMGEQLIFGCVDHQINKRLSINELKVRFEIFDYFESIKNPVSVKIHLSLLNSELIEFLNSRHLQFVYLERINKYEVFWSFLISWTTNNWHNLHNTLMPADIIIDKAVFLRVIESLNNNQESKKMMDDNFSTTKIYYEDLKIIRNNDWFNSNKNFSILDAKSIVKILNLEEVNNWLDYEGYGSWKMM